MATRRKKQKKQNSIKKQYNKYRRASLCNIRIKRGGYYGNSSEPGIEQKYGIPPPRPPPPTSPTTLAIRTIGGITDGIVGIVNKKLRELYTKYHIDDDRFIGYKTYNELILEKPKLEQKKIVLIEQKNNLTLAKNALISQIVKEKSTIKMLYKSVVNYNNQIAIKKNNKTIKKQIKANEQQIDENEQQIKANEQQIEEIEQQIDIVKKGVDNVIEFLKTLLDTHLKNLVDFYNHNNNYRLLNSVTLSNTVTYREGSDSSNLKNHLHSLVIILSRLFMLTEDFINISHSDMPKPINKKEDDPYVYELSMFNDFNDFKTELDKYVIIFRYTYEVLLDYKDKIKKGLEYHPSLFVLPPPSAASTAAPSAASSASTASLSAAEASASSSLSSIDETYIPREYLISEIERLGKTTSSVIPDLENLNYLKLLEIYNVLKPITAGGQYRGKKKSKKSKS